jgi:hypothetical protein
MQTSTRQEVRLQVWVPPRVAASVKGQAADQRRSVSAIVRNLIEDDLHRKQEQAK